MLEYSVSFPFSVPELSFLCINVYLLLEAQQIHDTFGTGLVCSPQNVTVSSNVDSDLYFKRSLLKSYKRLSFEAQWLLTFNLSVVNEELFTKQSQSSGNQSSLTSVQTLNVRLSVVNDVFSAEPISSCQEYLPNLPPSRSPSK